MPPAAIGPWPTNKRGCGQQHDGDPDRDLVEARRRERPHRHQPADRAAGREIDRRRARSRQLFPPAAAASACRARRPGSPRRPARCRRPASRRASHRAPGCAPGRSTMPPTRRPTSAAPTSSATGSQGSAMPPRGSTTSSPAAHSPATQASGAAPRGRKASTVGNDQYAEIEPRFAPEADRRHRTGVPVTLSAIPALPRTDEDGAGLRPSARFDLSGSLTIVLPLSQERGRLAPASCVDRAGRSYWDNNNLNRIRLS